MLYTIDVQNAGDAPKRLHITPAPAAHVKSVYLGVSTPAHGNEGEAILLTEEETQRLITALTEALNIKR